MFNTDHLILEFDSLTRIMHITGEERLYLTTQKDLCRLYEHIHRRLEGIPQAGMVYIVTNLSQLIIDPNLAPLFAVKSRELLDLFEFLGGIARYGYQVSRLTIRHGYRIAGLESPNLFGARPEAFAYIYGLIRRHRAAEPVKDTSDAVAFSGPVIPGIP